MPRNTAKCWYCYFTRRKSCHREVYSESVTSTKMRLVNHCRNLMSYSHSPWWAPTAPGSRYFRYSSWEAPSHVPGSRATLMTQGLNKLRSLDLEKPVNKGCWRKHQPSTQHWDKSQPPFWELSAIQSTGYRSFGSYPHRNISVQPPASEPVWPY